MKNVAWDCGWGVAHYRASLLALLKVCEQHPEVIDVVRGREVTFGQVGKFMNIFIYFHLISDECI